MASDGASQCGAKWSISAEMKSQSCLDSLLHIRRVQDCPLEAAVELSNPVRRLLPVAQRQLLK